MQETTLNNGTKVAKPTFDAKGVTVIILSEKHADVYGELTKKCHDPNYKLSVNAQKMLQANNLLTQDGHVDQVVQTIIQDKEQADSQNELSLTRRFFRAFGF